MNLWRSVLLLLAVLVVGTSVAEAQNVGRIAGRVTKGNDGVGGVTVLVAETKAVTVTDGQGRFSFPGVPAGSYTLLFTQGDNNETRPGVAVTAGATVTVDVTVDWEVGLYESLTVYSASKRIEKIVDAPAAVSVISEKQIERDSAHGQVPKVLEFTPGAEVTQSGIYDFNFNTRGFNSSLNRRVATYIDGRDTAVPFLGAQEWSALAFPLDDLANIEFIRGPSAALYGANSSAGVINMTSRAPRDSQGGVARVTAGELESRNLDLRWADELGGGWYYKLMGGVRASSDFSLSRDQGVEYSRPCTFTGEDDCLPQELIPRVRTDNDILFATARFDKYLADDSVITFESGYTDAEGPIFQSGIGRIQVIDAKRPFFRGAYSREHWNVLASYSRRDAQQKSLQTTGDLFTDTKRYSIEVQTNWNFGGGKGRIVGGGAHTEEEIDTLNPMTNRQSLMFEPVDNDRQALFAQVDYRVNEHLKLVGAGRIDENKLHSTRFSPKAALVYNINPKNTMRFTYNEAFQVANYSEFFLQADVAAPVDFSLFENGLCVPRGFSCGLDQPVRVLALGNRALDIETTKGFEMGYSGIFADKTFFTIDYYTTQNENFITDLLRQDQPSGLVNPAFPEWVGPDAAENTQFLPGVSVAQAIRNFVGAVAPPGTLFSNNLDGAPIIAAASYTNFGEVDTQGVDVGMNFYFNDRWNLQASYSWFDFDVKSQDQALASQLLPNSPENKASAGVTYRGPRLNASFSGRWMDDFRWSVGVFEGDISSYSTFDLNGAYSVADSVKVGVTVANVFDDNHFQAFGGDILGRRALGYLLFNWQ